MFDEACRREQTIALQARVREFLKEQRILEPAEFRIARVSEDRRDQFEEPMDVALSGTIFQLLACQIA